ncbi:MAG: hypothetical protein QOE69_2161, partial [Thermoleophilaceae bacterium]|nr:hypothetical protein [Thermoleophilaceae bacterium]
AGNGGTGGSGGPGGGGGSGGSKGTTDCASAGGDGGAGGMGGTGGTGGPGGGGAGGPSAGLFGAGTARFVTRSAQLEGGTAGQGGLRGSSVVRADDGQSAGTLADSEANATPADFDGDGFTDPTDLCPADAATGAGGCPARGAVLADSDGDGVPDREDACPTQSGISTNGCPAPPGRIKAKIRAGWTVGRNGTLAKKLLVLGAPPGAAIAVRCTTRAAAKGSRAAARTRIRAGCPASRRTYTVGASGKRSLVLFMRRRLRPGTRLTVIVTAPRLIGKAVTFTIRRGKRPKVKTQCTAPGSATPRNSC